MKEILYPERSRDGNADTYRSNTEWQNRGGADGGKRIRSISKDDQNKDARKFDKWEPAGRKYTETTSSIRYEKDYSSRSDDINSKSDWDFVNNLFDDLDNSSPSKSNDKSNTKRSTSTSPSSNDFNNLLDNMLDDMVKDKPKTDKNSNSDSNKVIQDFLKDLNTNTNNDKRVSTKRKAVIDDDLDFDKLFGDLDDLDNVFNDNDNNINSKNKKSISDKNNSNISSKVPSMEDYPTFEAYLDALGNTNTNNNTIPIIILINTNANYHLFISCI